MSKTSDPESRLNVAFRQYLDEHDLRYCDHMNMPCFRAGYLAALEWLQKDDPKPEATEVSTGEQNPVKPILGPIPSLSQDLLGIVAKKEALIAQQKAQMNDLRAQLQSAEDTIEVLNKQLAIMEMMHRSDRELFHVMNGLDLGEVRQAGTGRDDQP